MTVDKRERMGATKKKYAYDEIKKLIIENEIPKDAPLVERQLSELIGLSRTPIREALRDLANDGMVEIIEGKGVYVKGIDFKDMVELFEVREALECMAIRLFVERIDNYYFGNLSRIIKEQENAYDLGDHKQFMDLDMQLHYVIAEGSKNVRLQNQIEAIYDQIRRIAISSRDDKIMRDTAMKAHRDIMDAVLKRDIETAQKAMADHIRVTLKLHKEKYYLL